MCSESLRNRAPAHFPRLLEDEEVGEVWQGAVQAVQDAIINAPETTVCGSLSYGDSRDFYGWDSNLAVASEDDRHPLERQDVRLDHFFAAGGTCPDDSDCAAGGDGAGSGRTSAYASRVWHAHAALADLPSVVGAALQRAIDALSPGLRDRRMLEVPLSVSYTEQALPTQSSLVLQRAGGIMHGELLMTHRMVMLVEGSVELVVLRSDATRKLGLYPSRHPRHHQMYSQLYRREEDPLPNMGTERPSGLIVQLGRRGSADEWKCT